MLGKYVALVAPVGFFFSGCGGSMSSPVLPSIRVAPPVAEAKPHDVSSEHGVRQDPYYWLRDDTRQSPAVLGYLEAENNYTQAVLAPTQPLQDALYAEMIARLKQDDSSVPVFDNGYWYYRRYEIGKEYPINARREKTMDAPEQILLDVNELAVGHGYFRASGLEVSSDNKWLAYAEDSVGRSQYRLRIKNLDTGVLLEDTVENITGTIVWANDSRTVYYVANHPKTLLSNKVYRHTLGTPIDRDVLVYEEKDTAFYLDISKAKSKKYIWLALRSTVSSEQLLIDADRPDSAPRVFFPRESDHEYEVEHINGRFVIRTNWQAKNFRVMTVGEGSPGDRSAWRDVVPHEPSRFIHGFAAYNDFLAVSERSGGLRKIRVLAWSGNEPFHLQADEPAYTMHIAETPEAESDVLRYTYSSLTTPESTYEYNVESGERTLLKRDPVLGDFQPEHYVTEYLHATARDGKKVPISVVYRKETRLDGSAPLYQTGYGSYGHANDPRFSNVRLSLLDRGFVVAIAHIRGGQELGREWYEDGKLLNKRHTFEDFIDVTEHLVKEGYAARHQVFADGRSAGGLLMGAIVNMRPDLYRGVIAGVPFVDVVTTMLDEDIPLTSNELDEWGNPKVKKYYEYMLSYSPYDNVAKQAHPSLLVTTGLWDSQVQYFEPAKWVAKLRATKTDDNLLLLHTNMEAGHGGRSGRYQSYKEDARNLAFVLYVLERADSRRQ